MTKNINNNVKKTKESLIQYFKKIIEIIKKPEMGMLPGQLAFFMLLSLVPIITLCGFAAGIFNINMDTVISWIEDFVPSASSVLVPYLTGDTIDISLALVLIWMFYIASNGFNTVILISNQIYGINKSNFFRRRVKAIFMTISIVVLIVFLLVVPVFGNKVVELFGYFNMGDTVLKLFKFLEGPFTWLVMFIFIRTIYEIAPDRVRKNSHLNTGAIFTSIGWIVVTYIYSIYANNMPEYNIFYGALTNIAVLMLWLYFISYVFVIGLCLNHGEEIDKETMEKTGAVKVVKQR